MSLSWDCSNCGANGITVDECPCGLGYRPWDWSAMSVAPIITWELISNHPRDPWDWGGKREKAYKIEAQKLIARTWRRRQKYKRVLEEIGKLYNLDEFVQKNILRYCLLKLL